MGNEKKLRLIQVAKEFNVGLNTVTDFLQKKGIKSDGSPNTQIDAATYAILEKEFGSNRSTSGARDSVRERIAQKQSSVTIEKSPKPAEEKEVIIKSNVISVKDEIPQPKILGKIDLSPKKPEAKVEAPKAEAPKAAPVEAPKAEPAKPVEEVKATEPVKPVEVKTEVKVAAPAPAPAPEAEKPKQSGVFRPESVTLDRKSVV